MKFKFELGAKAKDCITGFEGVIMSRAEFITGCNQYGLSPTKISKDGKRPDWEYFDENRLEITGKGIKLPGDEEEGKEKKSKAVRGMDGSLPERF